MRQLPLFEDLDRQPSPEDTSADLGDTAPLVEAPGSPGLFDRPVLLRNDLDGAIDAGRFEEARLCYVELETVWGESNSTRSVAFLGALEPSMFTAPIEDVLDRWISFSGRSISDPLQRRRAWRGFVTRLRDTAPPRTLVAIRSDCLVPIANALWEMAADAPEIAVEVRELIREALPDGRDLCPTDFFDHAIRDLLSENLEPIWLALLGAIRHLWMLPPATADEARTLLARAEGADRCEGDSARSFWDCLRVARSPLEDEALRHEARRRMKQLNPHLHALALAGTQ